jgi:hypothetical protein
MQSTEISYVHKLNEYLRNVNNLMYTFEVTKPCGYSTFLLIYKTQTLSELYSLIKHHFGNIKIVNLYFNSQQMERIDIHCSEEVICDFIRTLVTCNPAKIMPEYELPNPTVYRIFIEEEHTCDHYNK